MAERFTPIQAIKASFKEEIDYKQKKDKLLEDIAKNRIPFDIQDRLDQLKYITLRDQAQATVNLVIGTGFFFAANYFDGPSQTAGTITALLYFRQAIRLLGNGFVLDSYREGMKVGIKHAEEIMKDSSLTKE